jgi:hypothetical protein
LAIYHTLSQELGISALKGMGDGYLIIQFIFSEIKNAENKA